MSLSHFYRSVSSIVVIFPCALKKNDVQNILAVAPPIHPANVQFAEVFGRNNVVELQCSIHFKKHCNFFFLSGPTTCVVSSEFGLAKYFLQRYGELYEVFLQSCLSSELVVLFCPFLVQFRMYLQRRKYAKISLKNWNMYINGTLGQLRYFFEHV